MMFLQDMVSSDAKQFALASAILKENLQSSAMPKDFTKLGM